MKKICSIFAVLCLVACLTSTALADTAPVTSLPADRSIGIYGTYAVTVSKWRMLILGDEDNDHADFPGGVHLSAESSDPQDDGLQMLVIPVTPGDEPEAYAWASGIAVNAGSGPVIYYVAFYRGNMLVEPSGRVTVTVTAPEGYDNGGVHYLGFDQQLSALSGSYGGGSVSFCTNTSGYYVLTKPAAYPLPTPGGSGGSDRTTAPQTGDTFGLAPWLALWATLALGITSAAKKKRV